MDTIDIIAAIEALSKDHEAKLLKAEKHSNEHAYHLGQIHKFSAARQNLKDAISAEIRYAERTQE
jgi:hypothetical protein